MAKVYGNRSDLVKAVAELWRQAQASRCQGQLCRGREGPQVGREAQASAGGQGAGS